MKLLNNWIKFFPTVIIIVIITVTGLQSCEPDTGFTTELALNNDSIFMPKVAKITRVLVFSDRNWDVVKEDSTIEWMTLTIDSLNTTSGNGNGSFLVNVETNNSGLIRMATLIISTENKSHRLTFKQDIK